MSQLKSLAASLFSAGILVAALPAAHADEIADLKTAVQQLQAEVQQLKAEQTHTAQQAAATQTAVAEVKAQATAPAAARASSDPLTFGTKDNWAQLYGDIDQYANYMHSSSGANLTSFNDGALLRSRLGLKGHHAVSAGYAVNFDMEQSLDFETGAQPGAGRLFDRQAWAGVSTPVGEFRVGRQETIAFFHGGMVDFTSRTLGSVVNAFGVPARFDRDLSYSSPRLGGLKFEAHYALSSAGGSTVGSNGAVYQLGLDYVHGPIDVGYNGLWANPPSGATYNTKADYHNLYADYDYGHGKVYLTYVRTNVGPTSGFSGIGGAYPGGVPLTGTSAGINTNYDIYQVSADYDLTTTWRVGALYGQIKDTSDSSGGAKGWAAGTYYSGIKDTTLYALVDGLSNDSAAGFKESGSAPLSQYFSGSDLTGKKATGVQVGFVYKF